MKPLKTIFIVLSVLLLASPGMAAKATPLVSSFNGGEVSPLIDARSDLAKYQSGCITLENFIPLVEGGATRTPGTYFALETKTSSSVSRLFPFHFSTIQAYVIEAGDQYFRFYKDDGQIGTVDTDTTLLAHFDGTDGDTGNYTSDDTFAHTITTVADAQLDTAQFVFGTASMLFDGTGDYATVPEDDGVDGQWEMGTDPFTIDFWVRFSNLTGVHGIFEQWDDADNRVDLVMNGTLLGFTIRSAADTKFSVLQQTNMVINTWYHIAIVRGVGGDSDVIGYFVNGKEIYSGALTDAWPDLAATLAIGQNNAGSPLAGWIDEFRVSYDVARWTDDFTRPTQAYPFKDSGALTGGGITSYELATPYAAADLFDIKTVQSADVLFLFHPDYPTKELTRTGHTAWTLTDHEAKTGVAMTITNISIGATVTVTADSVADLANGDTVYVSDITLHADMKALNDTFYTISALNGGAKTFVLDGANTTGFGGVGTDGTVQETIFGTTDNRASCGAFFEQRLAMASTNNNPQTLYLSASADYDLFDLDDASAADSLQYTLVSDRVDRIRWMTGQDFLMIGTVGGVWKFGASTTQDPLTPTNVSAKKQITSGVRNIDASPVSDSVLWVSRSGFSVKQLSYSFDVDKYIAPDLTRIAKHIAYGATKATSGILEVDFQSEPLPIFWAIRKDGQLIGLTYETQEQVYAWFRVVTDGAFESIAIISRENDEDQIWVIANRTIDGNTVRYVEYFTPLNFYSTIEDAFFVHSGLSWIGTTPTTVTAITQADPVVATVSAGHGIELGDKLKFRYTGTWLDTHITTAHIVDGNDITLWLEDDSAAVDGTDFAAYVYPNTTTTITYTGDPQNITDIEQSNPVRITIVGHGLQADGYVRIASVLGMTEINGDHEILGVTADTFTINLDASAFNEYTSGGTAVEGSATTQDGTTESVIKILRGLSHLEAETVTALVDGAAHPDMTVASGIATLSFYGNKVHIGLPFDSTLEPMKLNAGSPLGTARGKKQRIYKITAVFYETNSGKAGPDTDSLKSIPFGTGDQPTLWTEDIDFQFPGDWGNEATITILQDTPLPMTVLGIVPYVVVNDD